MFPCATVRCKGVSPEYKGVSPEYLYKFGWPRIFRRNQTVILLKTAAKAKAELDVTIGTFQQVTRSGGI
jgi:hypothetical protein